MYDSKSAHALPRSELSVAQACALRGHLVKNLSRRDKVVVAWLDALDAYIASANVGAFVNPRVRGYCTNTHTHRHRHTAHTHTHLYATIVRQYNCVDLIPPTPQPARSFRASPTADPKQCLEELRRKHALRDLLASRPAPLLCPFISLLAAADCLLVAPSPLLDEIGLSPSVLQSVLPDEWTLREFATAVYLVYLLCTLPPSPALRTLVAMYAPNTQQTDKQTHTCAP